MAASNPELVKLCNKVLMVREDIERIEERIERLIAEPDPPPPPKLPIVSPYGFAFGDRSLRMLGVVPHAFAHPSLRAVAHLALCYSGVDFGCTSGWRSLAKQREFMDAGTSWVSSPEDSLHTSGHAVDLVPWVGGQYEWGDKAAFVEIHVAVWKAARELGLWVSLDHGHALWGKDRPHWQLTARPAFSDTTPAVTAYLARL